MKRFTDTDIWSEDWFLDSPSEFKLFWFYVKDKCNHAGIWRVNKRQFEFILGSKLGLNEFLKIVNSDKKRIEVLDCEKWYLTGFIHFQYGKILNENNRVHKSILNELTIYNIDTSTFEVKLRSNSGQDDHKEGVKDKDKDKDKENKYIEFIQKFNLIRKSKFTIKDQKAKRQFDERLKNGFTEDQILTALENLMKDSFHIENNFKYLTPEFITRSDKIEKGLNFTGNGTSGTLQKDGIRADLSDKDYTVIV
jgi:hypothetical protein